METQTRPEAPAVPAIPVFGSAATQAALMAIYDDRLRHWPVPFDEKDVPTRYGTTHVVASGDAGAPPLLLLHPASAGAIFWSSIIGALSDRHRCYAVDTIGDVGKSALDDPARHPQTGADYSAWLEDVQTALGVPAADVVAGSMGGWIAMSHAIHAPSRVRRLVLLGPMGIPSWRATAKVLLPMMWVTARPTEARRERLIYRCLGGGDRAHREYHRWMRLVIEGCQPRLGTPAHLPAKSLRSIAAPTLVFLGGNDRLLGSAKAAARRARNIPGCEIEILENAGHAMSIDQPDFVAERISQFLELH